MSTTIEDALYTKLNATAAITAFVGARIYPLKFPDNPDIPAITYQRINSIREQTLEGRVTYCEAMIQIDTWSKTYDQCKDIAREVFMALEGFRGTVSGVDIQGVLSQNELDLYEDEVRWFRRSQVFRFMFIES